MSSYIIDIDKYEIDEYIKNVNTYGNIMLMFILSLLLLVYYQHKYSYILCSIIFITITYYAYLILKFRRMFDGINNNNYKIIQIKSYLTPEECDQIIDTSNKFQLIDSETISDNGNVTSDYRKSRQTWLTDEHHHLVDRLSKFSKIITNYPVDNMEQLQYVHYDTSGYFNEHYDPDVRNNSTKDRIFTIIFYLNDVEEGGETYFKNIDTYIKPQKGDCVIFKSLDENGNILSNSLHQGMPVKKR